eukprot:CAMPEP_0170651554 /NCGR_PEP_ID=MMETSP0224-20130122/46433_1 /TAXON_ID=285029 /ORGANISM="Togula jolla, Strain CCCM 725" /LENGTH=299 /DNA_ID=CAMNT_0010983361 /DNA_START=68 /DNA_END=963 /DNA_ORIENTATION=+
MERKESGGSGSGTVLSPAVHEGGFSADPRDGHAPASRAPLAPPLPPPPLPPAESPRMASLPPDLPSVEYAAPPSAVGPLPGPPPPPASPPSGPFSPTSVMTSFGSTMPPPPGHLGGQPQAMPYSMMGHNWMDAARCPTWAPSPSDAMYMHGAYGTAGGYPDSLWNPGALAAPPGSFPALPAEAMAAAAAAAAAAVAACTSTEQPVVAAQTLMEDDGFVEMRFRMLHIRELLERAGALAARPWFFQITTAPAAQVDPLVDSSEATVSSPAPASTPSVPAKAVPAKAEVFEALPEGTAAAG